MFTRSSFHHNSVCWWTRPSVTCAYWQVAPPPTCRCQCQSVQCSGLQVGNVAGEGATELLWLTGTGSRGLVNENGEVLTEAVCAECHCNGVRRGTNEREGGGATAGGGALEHTGNQMYDWSISTSTYYCTCSGNVSMLTGWYDLHPQWRRIGRGEVRMIVWTHD